MLRQYALIASSILEYAIVGKYRVQIPRLIERQLAELCCLMYRLHECRARIRINTQVGRAETVVRIPRAADKHMALVIGCKTRSSAELKLSEILTRCRIRRYRGWSAFWLILDE